MCQDKCWSRRQAKAENDKLNIKWRAGEIDLSQLAEAEDKVSDRIGEAHHIWPKAVYPLLAYDLDNGICLCWKCHREVVHNRWRLWRQYVQLFKNLAARRKKNRTFNEKYQSKVEPK
jgi:hypothetical protein